MGRLRVILGDDHTLMRHGLRKILEDRQDWEVVAEAGDGRAAVLVGLSAAPPDDQLTASVSALVSTQVVRPAPAPETTSMSPVRWARPPPDCTWRAKAST